MGLILYFGGIMTMAFGLNNITKLPSIGIMLSLIGIVLICLGVFEDRRKK